MKKRILRITLLTAIVALAISLNGGLKGLLKNPTVQAFGDLIVDFHVPVGNPIFTLSNMFPGQSETRAVDITNNGSVPRIIAVKGFRTNGIGLDPKIETQLDFTIKNGSAIKYGPVKMSDFFSASNSSTNGVLLDIFNPSAQKTYTFAVSFPASSGNAFQAKSVTADFIFGAVVSDNLVINEVFYHVDDRHGLKEKKDKDEEEEDVYDRRWGIKDRRHYDKKKKTRLKYQWLEIYNPTDKEISLKNWRIYNNSGKFVTIHSNTKVKPGSFILIAKDASVWKFWGWHWFHNKIELGSYFGDGFDIDGDRAILKNANGVEVDRMSWGNDTSGFTPSGTNPKVSKGHSTERQAPGFDTNAASDWIDRNPPTPGS